MTEADAAYQQGYDRGFNRGQEYARKRMVEELKDKLPSLCSYCSEKNAIKSKALWSFYRQLKEEGEL